MPFGYAPIERMPNTLFEVGLVELEALGSVKGLYYPDHMFVSLPSF